ncbi:MAG: STAS domain-containing protein [Thermoguttaceae bacterium]|jgi:anti-sigma B factor antagonist
MANYEQLIVSEVDNVSVVRFREPWISGIPVIEKLGEELYGLVEKEGHVNLVLDFSTVKFLSSAVLGKLVRLNAKVRSRSGTMRLCNLQPQILEVFLVCKLDCLFEIERCPVEPSPQSDPLNR